MKGGAGFGAVLVGVLASLAGAGCSGPPGPAPLGSGCFPPPFSITPATAKPGSSITVTADDASCNPRYGDKAQIQLEVYDGSGAKVLETLVPMNDDGGFSASVELPAAAVPGKGMVAAYPYNLDWCDDTGRNNRVGALEGQEIKRVSCVLPSEPLQIEP
ncbi:MAG: hypothetical protein ABI563_00840 [Specibacter sp.]